MDLTTLPTVAMDHITHLCLAMALTSHAPTVDMVPMSLPTVAMDLTVAMDPTTLPSVDMDLTIQTTVAMDQTTQPIVDMDLTVDMDPTTQPTMDMDLTSQPTVDMDLTTLPFLPKKRLKLLMNNKSYFPTYSGYGSYYPTIFAK